MYGESLGELGEQTYSTRLGFTLESGAGGLVAYPQYEEELLPQVAPLPHLDGPPPLPPGNTARH